MKGKKEEGVVGLGDVKTKIPFVFWEGGTKESTGKGQVAEVRERKERHVGLSE